MSNISEFNDYVDRIYELSKELPRHLYERDKKNTPTKEDVSKIKEINKDLTTIIEQLHKLNEGVSWI